MALPTQVELNSLDFVFAGQPFVGQTFASVDVNGMDFVFAGAPFVVTQIVTTTPKPKIQMMIIG